MSSIERNEEEDVELKSHKKKKTKKDKREMPEEECEVERKKTKKDEEETNLEDNGRKKTKKNKKDRETEEEQVEEKKSKIEKASKKEEEKQEKIKINEIEVNTANNWEKADFGDDEKRMKFLKLMGASKNKKETTKESDQSSKHFRSKTEEEKVKIELEKQFNESLTNKLQNKIGFGIGFTNQNNTSNSHVRFDEAQEKPKQQFYSSPLDDKKAQFKKMSFVKSSE